MFVIAAVTVSAPVVITPFVPLFVMVVAIIDVPFVLSNEPVLVIVVAFIAPLFVNVPLFVIASLLSSVPILPLLVNVPLLSTAPFNVVAFDNVTVPLFVKSEVTLALNSASAAVSPANASTTTEL